MQVLSQGATTTVAIIGTGYVGMASAIGFAEFGHRVVGYDILPERVAQLQRGITPYREAGIEEALGRHLKTGAVRFVDTFQAAVSGAEFVVVAVGTPAGKQGEADLSGVHEVVARLKAMDISGKVIVVRSTVPPGTSEHIAAQLGDGVDVVFAPEFLREGTAVSDFMSPDRIVVGASTQVSAERYARLFIGLDRPLLITSLRDAELAKGMSNAFLAMKISFANQVANLCDDIGADALSVLNAVGHDHRIGRLFLHPGIGFGGPCFEKDLKSLIHLSHGSEANCELLEATLGINDRQPRRVAEIIEEELREPIAGLRVGVWGLSFKGGTDDLRDSLAIRVVDDLIARGAIVQAYDPSVDLAKAQLPFPVVGSELEAADADVLVVLTDWSQFRAIDPVAVAKNVRRGLVVDGRNTLDAEAFAAAGLRYRGIGRRRVSVQALAAA